MIILAMLICSLASCADSTAIGTSETTATPVIIAPSKYEATEYLDGELSFSLTYLHKDEANYLEANKDSKDYTDKDKIGTTKEIEIDGEKYIFSYKKSRSNNIYNNTLTEFYVNNDDFGKLVTAEFNAELNKVTAIYSIRGEEGYDITRDEAFEKAKEFLSAYSVKVSEYRVTYEIKRPNDTYYFHMNRYINGIETNESAAISINFDGTLNAYKLVGNGAFDGVDISGIDMEAVNAVIKEKADKIYEGYTYEITGKEVMLMRKADGSFALNFDIDTKVSGKELEAITKDRMTLFITFE